MGKCQTSFTLLPISAPRNQGISILQLLRLCFTHQDEGMTQYLDLDRYAVSARSLCVGSFEVYNNRFLDSEDGAPSGGWWLAGGWLVAGCRLPTLRAHRVGAPGPYTKYIPIGFPILRLETTRFRRCRVVGFVL